MGNLLGSLPESLRG